MNQAQIIHQVQQVFNKLSQNHSQPMSKETVIRFLDQQSNKMYDRVLFEQLYSRMQKTDNGQITINDFISILMEALQSLKNKISILEQQVAQKQLKVDDDQLHLQQLQNVEEYNSHKICKGSKIRITIFDAAIQFPGHSRVAIILGCDDKKYSTKPANRQAPAWNEKFEFNISTGDEEIYIVILDEELIEKQEIGGQAKLNLKEFHDQKPHDISLQLKDKYGVVLYSTLNLRVQWIHSQTKYFKESIKENQQVIDDLAQDINEYKSDILQLFYPFDEKHQNQPNEKYLVTEQSTVQQVHDFQFYDTSQAQLWVKLALAFTLIYFVLVLIANLFKTQFVDLIVLFYSLFYYMNNNKLQSLLHFKIISLMIIVTIIFDIVWLVIYTNPWTTNSVLFFQLEHGLQMYEVIISYILLAIKVILLCIYANLYLMCPDKRVNIYDAQYEMIFGHNLQKSEESQNQDAYSFRNTNHYLHQSFSKNI
ncbi:unnamed protein product [Paramecium octaurelia]|uniref:C2 domain-containing protein n=1 Tax=Paramecium octaurelia TaxID=43137 RepID=A0A8S1Y267_PAROT|nr:unnamed protein product [Paramecium octaurelia]